MNMEEFLNKYPSPPSLQKIKWPDYPLKDKPTTNEDTCISPDTSDIEIWSCFLITKNPCDKITMNDAYLHYSKNTLNPLTKIQFGKKLYKKEGITRGFLYIGKNTHGNKYSVKCWCGLKLKSTTSNIKEENILTQPPKFNDGFIYPIDL